MLVDVAFECCKLLANVPVIDGFKQSHVDGSGMPLAFIRVRTISRVLPSWRRSSSTGAHIQGDIELALEIDPRTAVCDWVQAR